MPYTIRRNQKGTSVEEVDILDRKETPHGVMVKIRFQDGVKTWVSEKYLLNDSGMPTESPPQRHPSSAKFAQICQEMVELHDRKQKDYGSQADPFANLRASTVMGIEPWKATVVRMNDKMTRLHAAVRGQNLANESVVDSFMDLAVYAIIARILYEGRGNEKESG